MNLEREHKQEQEQRNILTTLDTFCFLGFGLKLEASRSRGDLRFVGDRFLGFDCDSFLEIGDFIFDLANVTIFATADCLLRLGDFFFEDLIFGINLEASGSGGDLRFMGDLLFRFDGY